MVGDSLQTARYNAVLPCPRFKYVSKLCGDAFSARVPFVGMTVHVGRYETAEDAAKAVDIARVFLVRIFHVLV